MCPGVSGQKGPQMVTSDLLHATGGYLPPSEPGLGPKDLHWANAALPLGD